MVGGRNPLFGCAWCRRGDGRQPGPGFVIVPGTLPLVDKQTGEIEYVVAHLPDVAERLDAMTPVRG
jgi:hypothetical protein